jgi:hypothetical protein
LFCFSLLQILQLNLLKSRRSRDHNCKNGYLREEELVSQLAGIIDQLDINEIGLKKQFQEEVERYNKFQRMVFKVNEQKNTMNKMREFDIRMYAKYILKEGSLIEKREMMASLKSKLSMTDKKIILEKNPVVSC